MYKGQRYKDVTRIRSDVHTVFNTDGLKRGINGKYDHGQLSRSILICQFTSSHEAKAIEDYEFLFLHMLRPIFFVRRSFKHRSGKTRQLAYIF